MADSTLPPVVIGLAAGLALIAVFATQYYQDSNDREVIDQILVPLDRGNTRLIIDTVAHNETVVELLKGRNVTLFFISENAQATNCARGSCAWLIMQSDKGYIHVYVDYVNRRVTGIHSDD